MALWIFRVLGVFFLFLFLKELQYLKNTSTTLTQPSFETIKLPDRDQRKPPERSGLFMQGEVQLADH